VPDIATPRARCVHLLPDTDAAGAENQALALLRSLSDGDDLDLELAYFEEGRNHASFEALGLPLRRLGRERRFALDAARRVRALRRAYDGRPPALLHTWLFEAHVVGLWAARAWRSTRTVVAQRSGTMERELPAHMVALRIALRRADLGLANSSEGAELLLDLGVPKPRVSVVPQGIPRERLAVRTPAPEVRARLGVAPGDPLIVVAGRPDRTKDLPGLVEAMGTVWGRRAGAVLALVGSDAAALAALGVSLPERARAVGWVDRPADYIAAADAVVIPSWTEGHSNAAGEALMLGRPVVATDTGAHPAIVAEAGGRVVPVRDPPALAAAILEVLADPPEPERVRAVAERHLGMGPVVAATRAAYESLL
jgi:glycosyltransferase involved in cell wall biosynthesis